MPRSLASWLVKCLENGKRDFSERSMSITQWTMGTFSDDAKDAGKRVSEKNVSSPFPRYLERNQNRSSPSRIR